MKLLNISEPTDIKQLNDIELNNLCFEIRDFLIENISKTGGHLSSNLGIVELTVAIHFVFNSPNDKLIFDVGHQSYVHKILTGRATNFETLRKYNGLSGFQKRSESKHDIWEAGHSSTALSAAVAMAVARDLDDNKFDIIPIIGDAAMLGGPSLEALNHLSSLDTKVILILNDNEMSIGKRVGNISNFVNNIRTSNAYTSFKVDYKSVFSKNSFGRKILKITSSVKNRMKSALVQNTLFDDFGLSYIGPVDGHDIKELKKVLNYAKNSNESVLIHIKTTKGKGYKYSTNDNEGKWHGTGPFDIMSGKQTKSEHIDEVSWSKVVADSVLECMNKDKDILAITPAMVNGSSLNEIFKKHPLRCFDVGIAEQHALTFVAGLSISGKKPFISIYSSFIQRGYDQINHDIARMQLPCIISIDRAGIVGSDGPTHHGVFDIGIFYPVPNLVIFAPSNRIEADIFIKMAFKQFDKPYIIRIPRGTTKILANNCNNSIDFIGQWQLIDTSKKSEIIIITYGDNVNKVNNLCISNGINATIINARFIKPLDYDMLDYISSKKLPILVYETDLKNGGLATYISQYYSEKNLVNKFYSIGIEDKYSVQGSIEEVYIDDKIDLETLKNKIREIING